MHDEVTLLIHNLRSGDRSALDQLLPIMYSQLRNLAASYLQGECRNHTLQPTALVHEAYLRLVAAEYQNYHDRAHFFGIAANTMRRILVDHARSRYAAKRGGRHTRLPLNEALDFSPERASTVIALDDALSELAASDPTKAGIVEMRFFSGMTADEIAQHLSTTPSSVRYHLRLAMAWLHRQVSSAQGLQNSR